MQRKITAASSPQGIGDSQNDGPARGVRVARLMMRGMA
jgi:hypothetical protein